MAKRKAETDDQYTKPDLREQVKAEVMAGDKGGKPGQWSARKAQLVAHEYEARGGGYKHERTETQEHLHEWTAEHWKTSDGKPAERDGKTTRYLPEAGDQREEGARVEGREAVRCEYAGGGGCASRFGSEAEAGKEGREDVGGCARGS